MYDLENVLKDARDAFNSGRTRDVEFRKKQLRALLRMLEIKEDIFVDSLSDDLRRSRLESLLYEIDIVRNELRNAIGNLNEWCKPEVPSKGIINIFDGVRIKDDPYGVVLIIGAWNFPLMTTLVPLIGAIAAGNSVIVKLSELVVNTSRALADLLGQFIDKACYKIVLIESVEDLVGLGFDYIFYTGVSGVGKIVRDAATETGVPVTCVVGGKNATYIDNTVDFDVCATRVIWGKIINAGQSRLAPDFILCTKDIEKQVVEACGRAIKFFLGDFPKSSQNYCRIINDDHYTRLVGFLSEGRIAYGGDCDVYEKYIEPTILTDVDLGSPVMVEEIFGPILPIVTVVDLEDAIKFINSRGKSMAIYLFSNASSVIDKFVHRTSSGSVCINDVMMQYVCEGPYGGVGSSGIGSYGGKYTYDAFSHKKTCLYRDLSGVIEMINSPRYPPYTEEKVRLIRNLMKKRFFFSLRWIKNLLIFLLGMAVVAAYYHYSR